MMKKFSSCISVLTLFFVLACNSSSQNNLSNTEKEYQAILDQQIDTYCNCLEPYKKYLASKSDIKDVKSSKMGREMSKKAQTCIQHSDRDNPIFQDLSGKLSLTDRRMYNSQFEKKFTQQCPDNAQFLIELWGKIQPMPNM